MQGREGLSNNVAPTKSLLSIIGHIAATFFIAVFSVPTSVALVALIMGWLMWLMLSWLFEQLMRPLKSVIPVVVGFLVFCKNATPMVTLFTMGGCLIGVCSGVIVCGGVLGFIVGLFIEIIRQTDIQEIPYTPRERRENFDYEGGGSYLYGGSTYTAPPPKQTTKVYKNPWAWQGFQVQDGPKEDNMRMDL